MQPLPPPAVARETARSQHGDHLTTVSVSPEFDGAPQLLVVGGGWVPLDVDLEPLVVPGDAVPVLDLTCGPYPLGGARGRGVLEGQLHPGSDGVFGIQGGGFLFGPALRLGFWLGRRFGLCGGLALLRTRAAPCIGLSLLGGCALGLLYRRGPGAITGCSRVAGTSGLDVGTASFSWNTCLVMRPSTSSASRRVSGGSLGQVRSRCPVPVPWRRTWAV